MPMIGTDPRAWARGGRLPLDPPGQATPRPKIGEPEDSERLEPAGQAVRRRDVILILQRKRQTKAL